MLEQLLVGNPWLSLALFAAVYLSDYYLTILSARRYRGAAGRHISFAGSLELTPQFQRDVDALRPFSPQLLVRLFIGAVFIVAIWYGTVGSGFIPELFAFLMGALLREAAVHMRHARNLALFGAAGSAGALDGHITYSRRLVLVQSAVELLSFAGLFLLCWLLTGSWFMSGGAFSCAVTGVQHIRLSRRAASLPAATMPAGR